MQKQQRTTKQKRLVMRVAQSHCDHPTADEIYLEVRAIDGQVSRGTVYRNLSQLAEMGQLMHVKVPGADRYDSRLDFHYHLLCSACGAVSDAPISYRQDIDEQVQEQTGFMVKRHRTVFEGLCPACKTKAQATNGENPGQKATSARGSADVRE